MDLGDRLIKLANKLLSAGSSETLGTQGGITNATANDILVPTSKAVKDYVDGRTQPATTSSAGVVQLSDDIDSSSSTVAATSAAIKQLSDLIGENASAIGSNTSAIGELSTSKVDKVTGKGLSTYDFDRDYKLQLDDLLIYRHDNVQFVDGQTVVYDSNNPWEYQQLGSVVHITGNFKCWESLPSTNPIKVAHRLPQPFKEVVAIQQGVGKNTYTLKIDEAGDMYIYNYGTTSVSNFPANVGIPVHITYLTEW